MIDGKKFKTKKIISLTKKTRITIKKDLEKYRKLAREFGATDSKIVLADCKTALCSGMGCISYRIKIC